MERDWYMYDDLRKRVKLLGDYNDMLDNDPSAMERGVLYFYD